MSNGVKISIKSTLDELSKEVGAMPNTVIAKSCDRILGTFGSETRKVLGKQHEKELHFGKKQIKSYNKQKIVRESVFDEKHGWYKGEDGIRIIGFKYENKAYRQGEKSFKKRFEAFSDGYVYSLVNNLWGKDVEYSKDSPYFHGGWYKSSSYGRWRAGDTRKKRITFNDSFAQKAVQPTLRRAEEDIRAILKQEGF